MRPVAHHTRTPRSAQDPHIRPAQLADAPALARIHVRSWQSAYHGILPAPYLAGLSMRRERQRWRDRLAWQGTGNWLIELDGDVAGFAVHSSYVRDPRVAGFAGEVHWLYLEPNHRGRGLGRRLMEHALADLETRGHRWVVVWVLEDNHGARAFYEKLGLRPDGARRTDEMFGQRIPVIRYGGPVARWPDGPPAATEP